MTKQFDKKHGAKPSEFDPQDPVLLLNFKLGKAHWLPGTIVERVRHSPTYRVLVPSLGKRIVYRHANQLRRRFAFEEDGLQLIVNRFRQFKPTKTISHQSISNCRRAVHR
uniref:Uncharacterized protein n=1 Tax=Globodera rostochiensis TaxID=31243 RepID=A0A914HS91_GLORO